MNLLDTVRNVLGRFRQRTRHDGDAQPLSDTAVSTDYRFLGQIEAEPLDGWRQGPVAQRQHEAFAPLLEAARAGEPRLDFVVAAQAIAETGLTDPLVVEVGCGSGYYSEVLSSLLGCPVRYVGLDYSSAMTSEARRAYPHVAFVTADACHLPFAAACCDVLLSGGSLMHIKEYPQAIAESVRVTRQWCVFHTVAVMTRGKTVLLSKLAYGGRVVEVIFNKQDLEALFAGAGLAIQQVFESIPYDVRDVVGEATWTLTYLCRKEDEK